MIILKINYIILSSNLLVPWIEGITQSSFNLSQVMSKTEHYQLKSPQSIMPKFLATILMYSLIQYSN